MHVLQLTLLYVNTAGQNEKSAQGGSSDLSGLQALTDLLTSLFVDPSTSLPLPNALDNESLTYFRNTLLVSIANLRSSSKQPLTSVATQLLSFFENNANENKAFDDSHYKAVLLYCLSKVKFFKEIKNWSKLLNKITDNAKFVLSADQSQAWTLYRLSKSTSPTLGGGGILSAAAIHCIAEMEVERLMMVSASPSMYEEFFRQGAPSLLAYETYFRQYSQSGINITPSLVRSAALEAFVRVSWVKQFLSPLTIPADFSALAIDAVCDVISKDTSLQVRQNAALTLLHVIQYRPSRVVLSGLSFGEPLAVLGLGDMHAYTLLNTSGNLRFKHHKGVMNPNVPTEVFQRSIRRLWNTITGESSGDQVNDIIFCLTENY